MGPEFFQTVMGHRFYDSTMPNLVEAIEKNAKAMNRLAAAMEENNKLLLAAKSTDGQAKPIDEAV